MTNRAIDRMTPRRPAFAAASPKTARTVARKVGSTVGQVAERVPQWVAQALAGLPVVEVEVEVAALAGRRRMAVFSGTPVFATRPEFSVTSGLAMTVRHAVATVVRRPLCPVLARRGLSAMYVQNVA